MTLRRTVWALPAQVTMVLCAATWTAPAQSVSSTQVVLLGTGNPAPNPDRSGPCTAIVVNGTPYLIDLGPGVVRRANAAFQKGIAGLAVTNLKTAFVTHLHSDHTVGYPDFLFTAWVNGRTGPVEVYGPKGVRSMTDHILAAWKEDIQIRTGGLERNLPGHNDNGYKVNVHEIEAGVVHKDRNVTVKAFRVAHGEWPQAFGYRFDTPDRSIVISGDARPSPAVVDACNGCDVLIHEVYTQAGYDQAEPAWKEYRVKYHTSTRELAELASKAKPKLLILYHQSYGAKDGRVVSNEQDLLREMKAAYAGKFVSGHDLDIY